MTTLPTIQPSRDFIIEPVYQTPTELTAGVLQALQRLTIPLLGTADPTLADLVGLLIHLQREHGEQASLEDTIQVYVGRVLTEQYASRRLRTIGPFPYCADGLPGSSSSTTKGRADEA